MQPTFIAGKDACLENSIAYFQQQLTKIGFEIEETNWLNPVPNVWSVHIRDKHCSLCFTNGKGSSRKAALASALGEFFERLSTNYFFADYYLGKSVASSDFVHYPNEKWFTIPENQRLPDGLLDSYLRNHYDPQQQLTAIELIDLQSSNSERGICALPFVRQSDQKITYIPMNIIGNLYVSNGMSAGNTQYEARVQALSEILERYVKNRIISEAISLPMIPQQVMQHYPHLQQAIHALETQGLPIYAFDASLGGHYPVICVVLFNPNNGTCFASFGAHPNFAVALERTITELLQGRSLQQLDVFAPPTFYNDDVAEHTNLETHFIDSSGLVSWDLFKQTADYPFTKWDFSGTTQQEFDNLMALLTNDDKAVYIADYQHLGVHTCRIIIPGMSEIYPIDDLLWANNNIGINLRDTLLALPDSDWQPSIYLKLLEQLEELGLDEQTRVRELLGLATGKDNLWFTLRIGELKSMLALAGGDLAQAQLWVEWTYEFNQSVLSDERCHYYRCLNQLLILTQDTHRQVEEYFPAMTRLYGTTTVQTAWQQIQGIDRFFGLTTINSNFDSLPVHQALLQAYDKLQQSKRIPNPPILLS